MKFRLSYKGDIYSAQNKNKNNQHEIREKFHYQIKTLLESERVHDNVKNAVPLNRDCFNFVPIVWKINNTLDCSINILFLRRDMPTNTNFAGDIDNRCKTLLDALAIPCDKQIPDGATLGQGQEPFYCLFEDDRLITHLSVEMGQWLEPQEDGRPRPKEALVIISVSIEPGLVTKNGDLHL